MLYKVVDKMFFAADILVKSDLTKEQADILSQELNENEVDSYRWYEVEKQAAI